MWFAKYMVGNAEVVVGIEVAGPRDASRAAVTLARSATTITREEWRLIKITPDFPVEMVYSVDAIERQRMQAQSIRRAWGKE